MDRSCRAAPALHRVPEVLGPDHSHGLVQGQGHTRCVGAGQPLVPVAALDETDRLGLAQQARGATDPEQLACGVGDGHDRIAVTGSLAQDVIEKREHLRERMGLTVVAQGVTGQGDRGVDGVGVHARGGRAKPRLGHLGSHTLGGPSSK